MPDLFPLKLESGTRNSSFLPMKIKLFPHFSIQFTHVFYCFFFMWMDKNSSKVLFNATWCSFGDIREKKLSANEIISQINLKKDKGQTQVVNELFLPFFAHIHIHTDWQKITFLTFTNFHRRIGRRRI